MEAGADTQQSGETAVAESEAQHITLAQVNVLWFSFFTNHLKYKICMSPWWPCGCVLQASIAAAQVSSSNPTVTLVQLPNGQTVQVHGVIQAAQPSVIQSPQVQTVQVRGAYI